MRLNYSLIMVMVMVMVRIMMATAIILTVCSCVQDPLGNGIKQWRGVKGMDGVGVVELSMPTSRDPELGDWVIDVTVLVRHEHCQTSHCRLLKAFYHCMSWFSQKGRQRG